MVTQHHYKIRDALGDLAALGYRKLVQEPLVSDGYDSSPALIGDLGVRGVWIPLGEVLFDVKRQLLTWMPLLMSIVLLVLFSSYLLRKRKSASIYVLPSCNMPFYTIGWGTRPHEALLFLQRLAERVGGLGQKL